MSSASNHLGIKHAKALSDADGLLVMTALFKELASNDAMREKLSARAREVLQELDSSSKSR